MTAPAHLGVIAFLSTEMDARALRAALDFGLIDVLAAAPADLGQLSRRSRLASRSLALLVDMLEANRVVARDGDVLRLTPAFRDALRFRDLLETRIAFADLVWPDIHSLFSALLADTPQFMARSKTFDLFRYDRCFELSAENRAATQAWTRFTTCLTKYEADAALDEIDLGGVGDFVDLGGNTGEFSLALRRRRPDLLATVVDLPVVCAIGRDHVAAVAPADAAAIAFHACDMRRDPLPAPADLVAFKSALHDWPDADARRLLARGAGRGAARRPSDDLRARAARFSRRPPALWPGARSHVPALPAPGRALSRHPRRTRLRRHRLSPHSVGGRFPSHRRPSPGGFAMSGERAEVERVVVVGGGTAGWMAALYLRHLTRARNVSLTLVESPTVGSIGVGEATVPSIVEFLRTLGIDESEFMRRCSATFKLGDPVRRLARRGRRPIGTPSACAAASSTASTCFISG